MDKSLILTLLQRPIAFHRVFVPLGGVCGALFLSQLLYWSDRGSSAGGWIYKTQEEWQEETGLTRYEQCTARKSLRGKGILEENLTGIPARLHYRINFEKLGEFLEGGRGSVATQFAAEQQSGCGNTKNKFAAEPQTRCAKAASKAVAGQQSTNTETTTEITAAESGQPLALEDLAIKAAATAGSIDRQIDNVIERGAVIENCEDKLVFAELIAEVGISKVLAAIKSIRTVDKRRAYASAVQKKIRSEKAAQSASNVRALLKPIEIDPEEVRKGQEILAKISRKSAARKS